MGSARLLLASVLTLVAHGLELHPDDERETVAAYKVSTVEDGQRYVLLVQRNCPVRYKDGMAPADSPVVEENVVDVSEQLAKEGGASKEYIDCEDLTGMIDTFSELELLPGFDGDFSKLELSWGDDDYEDNLNLGDYDEGDFEEGAEYYDDEGNWEGAHELDGGLYDDYEGDEMYDGATADS
ncbi:hypothetical protein T492DRAFT_995589 [Pavlovales sp. CCMP2436]|nr:hypothetical protein T492DRAFT_995589 [Pavlovales sp. CCMP2436]|mmetsp:Transcript_12286/g.30986  ORF Transcript_12286/g.30986 Transcript_12286/m.30986 type:complete len:182 (+) Transcript_12286:30-575(+)